MSWWRRNRLWLPAVPAALALMLAGNSYRVLTFWWDNGYHDRIAVGTAGQHLEVTDPDVHGTERHYRVRLSDVERLDEIEDPGYGAVRAVPDGMTALRLTLDWEADPDTELNYCWLTVVGADGTLYGGDQTDPLGQSQKCVPEDTPGPPVPGLAADEGATPRPGSWTTTPIVLVAADADLRALRIGFDWPEYAALSLPR